MPKEENRAVFVESYEEVLNTMHGMFEPLLARVKNVNGEELPADLKQRLEQAWEYFASRRVTVQIPPGATAVNFGPDHPVIHKLDYGRFALEFSYYNEDFDFNDNFYYRLSNGQPIPGSTLNEEVLISLPKPRRVGWESKETPQRLESGCGWVLYNESNDGVMEIETNSLRGNFWSQALWAAGAKPKIYVKLGESPIRFRGSFKGRMSITSAGFHKQDIGGGEIDAFLNLVEKLPVLEVYLTVR